MNIIDPDCLVCAECNQRIGPDDPIKVTPAVVHEACPMVRLPDGTTDGEASDG